MTRTNLLMLFCLLATIFTKAQTGSLQITFTPATTGKAVTIQVAVPFLKFNNAHGYWFTNPHNGDRHLQYGPEQFWADKVSTAGYITFNAKENDFDLYDGGNDTNSVSIQDKQFVIYAPEFNVQELDKNKPMHVHINSFSASECSFTISGRGSILAINGGTKKIPGNVQGSGHFYREPTYDKSALLPGCDCDPTIYAYTYDEENNVRTSSACENALKNKIFDAVQKSMTPLFVNIGQKENSKAKEGDINIMMMPGHVDISGPVKNRPYCSSSNRGNWLTTLNAQKTFYNNEDGYGLRLIKLPGNEIMGGDSDEHVAERQKKMAATIDSLIKLVTAKKISMEDAQKKMTALQLGGSNGSIEVDMKKEEIEHTLYLQVLFNPNDAEAVLLKMGHKRRTVVQHTVKGSKFEIYSPMIKDTDGEWTPNRLFIYIGNFSNPIPGKSGGGFDAYTTKAIYPPAGNKLSVYNIIIKLEGGKELIDKAMANLDIDTLEKLVTAQ